VIELGQTSTIDHDASRVGRWLRARRFRIALWIAVIEALVAWFTHDISKWTIVVAALILVPVYFYWGRERRSDTIRQISWILAASQALAVIAVIAAFIALAFVLVIAVIFAVVALVLIFADRR
jgi:membrane protein YdbS with pleckstrin-like domain